MALTTPVTVPNAEASENGANRSSVVEHDASNTAKRVHIVADSTTPALPSGSATGAKQDEQTALLTTIRDNADTVETLLTAIGSNTDAIESKQDTGNASLASVDSKLSTLNSQTDGVETTLTSIDTKLSSQSTATNQATTITLLSGKTPVTFIRTSLIITGSYLELVASLSDTVNEIHVYNANSTAIYLATGAAAAEVDKFMLFPGGNGSISIGFASGTRISAKAVTANATNEVIINFCK